MKGHTNEVCTEKKALIGLVKKLGFKIMKRFSPAACLVYLVEDRSGRKSIIKLIDKDNPWGWDACMVLCHLLWEKKVLEKATGIKGITHKLGFYDEKVGEKRYVALLKEFAPGKKLGSNVLGQKNIGFLRKTLENLHENGIARLDLTKRNIVMDGKKPVLVDLGSALLRENVSKTEFEDKKARDFRKLEEYRDSRIRK